MSPFTFYFWSQRWKQPMSWTARKCSYVQTRTRLLLLGRRVLWYPILTHHGVAVIRGYARFQHQDLQLPTSFCTCLSFVQRYLWKIIQGGMTLTIKNFDPHGNVGQTPNICKMRIFLCILFLWHWRILFQNRRCMLALRKPHLTCAPTKHRSSPAAISITIDASSGWSAGLVLPKAITLKKYQ